ncbi:MAG: esterase [Acidobacteria bacterium]|nr:MAG: esterase [Acidobacteriota bacterium]REK04000.1 MAG: esterase [Acidobacteriota bacterium]REK15162.1 MAG: esterase [Acidobacteriota bacterium]REK46252.1 MAG: esterase [Acidobacteriota bacterium]
MTESRGTIRVLSHESKALEGNPLGDPHKRNLPVYLPPGYDGKAGNSYPVVFLLSGFTGRGSMMLNESAFAPNIAERLDILIEKRQIIPMIAVLPDCFTRFGGSQYINSTATGRYEDYITLELVPFVDENFRTIPDRRSRAVAGKSSGGYGALILAMRHAEMFGYAASIAGDCYFEVGYKPDIKKAFRAIAGDPLRLVRKFWDEEESKGGNDFDGLNVIGMASCYSPNPDSDIGFDLPFDLATGEIREDVWARWLEQDPVHLAEDHADALRSIELLYIEAGKSDEFGLDIGARVLSKRLSELGIKHIHKEFEGGHFNINHRYNYALEAISKAMGR